MSRRFALTLAVLVMGLALLVASGLARPAGSASTAAEVRKGGTLRISRFSDVDFVDPALIRVVVVADRVCDLREAL